MDSHSKQSSGHSGGGSGEQGYGGGYGGYDAVGYGGESSMQRGFQDYALILRERMWYIIVQPDQNLSVFGQRADLPQRSDGDEKRRGRGG